MKKKIMEEIVLNIVGIWLLMHPDLMPSFIHRLLLITCVINFVLTIVLVAVKMWEKRNYRKLAKKVLVEMRKNKRGKQAWN